MLRRLIPVSRVGRIIEGVAIAVVGALIALAIVEWWPWNATTHVTVECRAPSRLPPGKLVRLAYDIKAQAAIDVGLGAGFYDENGEDYSRGTGDRDTLRLERGHTRVTRPFVVPLDLPAGIYELDAEIWPANKIGDDGVETLADNPCAFVTIP